jgi:outer membrane protein assembly factor BamD
MMLGEATPRFDDVQHRSLPDMRHSRAFLLAAIAAFGLAGCNANRAVREEAQFVEAPVELLYNAAARQMDRERFTEAVAGFEEVERQHPYSAWARRSILMIAYSNYRINQYEKSIEAAQRFISLHPGNEGAPYAYYLIGLSYFEQILDVGRDQRTTELALQALQDVARRYPQSDYARDARLKMDMVYDQLAGKEMAIGRYYLERDEHLAAINRFKSVVEDQNFQRTSHTPEALGRLVESYVSVGMLDEATKTAAVLGENFPGSSWYSSAYYLLTGQCVNAQGGVVSVRERGTLRVPFIGGRRASTTSQRCE